MVRFARLMHRRVRAACGGDLKPVLVTTQGVGCGRAAVSCMGFSWGTWVP
jgi:hypothetical protein